MASWTGELSFKFYQMGSFLAVQWLGLCTLTAEGTDSVLDEELRSPQALICGK